MFNIDFDPEDTIGVIGVNVWLWPRMFLMNLVNWTSRALTIMMCFFALVCVFVYRVRVGVSIENAILCV